MGTEHQARNTTPLLSTSKGASKLQRSQVSINDAANVFDEVSQCYDSEYTELGNILQNVADNVEDIKRYRMANITSLQDDIENLLNAADAARKSATDTTTLERHRQHVQNLQRDKQQLVQEILTGKDEEQEVRNKLNRVEQQMELVRQERETVKDQTTSDVPSLEYLKKVLQRLSHTYLTQGDRGVTEGFVCKNGTKDVQPFHFDQSVSHFDQVNQLWKIICDQ